MTAVMRRPNDVIAAQVEDVLLMMSIENGHYYGIKGVGPRVWELLEYPTTVDVIVERLLSEYDVTREHCTDEVVKFLGGLRERGLLTDGS